MKKAPCTFCGTSESLWFSFLTVRAKLIDELLAEPKTAADVALVLSMDPEQVERIHARRHEREELEMTGFDS